MYSGHTSKRQRNWILGSTKTNKCTIEASELSCACHGLLENTKRALGDISECICSEGLYFTAHPEKGRPTETSECPSPPSQGDGSNRLDKYIELGEDPIQIGWRIYHRL